MRMAKLEINDPSRIVFEVQSGMQTSHWPEGRYCDIADILMHMVSLLAVVA